MRYDDLAIHPVGIAEVDASTEAEVGDRAAYFVFYESIADRLECGEVRRREGDMVEVAPPVEPTSGDSVLAAGRFEHVQA